MARAYRVYLTGVKRIDRKLQLLPEKVQKKVMRPAVRDGLKLVKAEADMQVPVDTGLTQENIKLRVVKKRKVGRIAMVVAVTAKAPGLVKQTKAGKKYFYPAVVEYGDRDTPPNGFMRRSYAMAGPAAKDLTLQKILEGVERESLA